MTVTAPNINRMIATHVPCQPSERFNSIAKRQVKLAIVTMIRNNKKQKGEAPSSAVEESVEESVPAHTNSSIPVGSQIPVNPNVRSPLPISQSNVPASTQSDGITTNTEFGSNANFSGATAIAFGTQSTATYHSHNSYHIRLGDQELTETQVEEFMTGLLRLALPDKMERLVSSQSSTDLPHAPAAYNDFMPEKEHEPCLEGTRKAVLKEIGNWFLVIGKSQIYVLSGLAGIGKSTIAYTVAQRADCLGLLGASFFFSRKEAERRSAQKFFTTIAFHLCVYDDEFARAIEGVLATNRGKSATTKSPETQLKVLIIEPLRDLIQSRPQPVVIVVDALDECDDVDAQAILKALGQLVHEIPSFKVLLTTRPQPHLGDLLHSHDVFYLHNIEDKIVNNDIRNYLKFRLSMEKVKSILPTLKIPWNATDVDVDALVQAAGKLFIVASISVLFILNKTVRNPASQMERLRKEFAQNRTPFFALGDFYSIILHAVIPPDSDRTLVDRFQMVVGSIVLLYDPLPVDALSDLIGMQIVDIYGVLDNLQSVILLGTDDIPYIYHKSFSDWIVDADYCKVKDHRIDPSRGHRLLTISCLQTMNKRLKRNILNLDAVAQFMTPTETVKQREKIPPVLRYGCIYWNDHLREANVNDAEVIEKIKTFVNEHWLHWAEVLGLLASECWITYNLGGVIQFMEKTTLKDLRELFSDALRFIFKFNPFLERSVHFIYQSALPLTPTESLLYQRYNGEMMHNLCRVQGGPKRWDAVITSSIHGEHVDRITFGKRGYFASCSVARIRFWDSSTGAIRTALVNSFTTVVGLGNQIYFGLKDFLWSSNVDVYAPIVSIALSSSASRLAVASYNGHVTLWVPVLGGSTQIAKFDGFGSDGGSSHHLAFSPDGDRIAFRLASGGFALRNAINGEHICDLNRNSAMVHRLLFSPDGSQLASLLVEGDHKYTLTLWNSTDGKFLGAAQDVGSELAFSADGSLIATGGWENALKLWSRNNENQDLHFIETPHLSSLEMVNCLAFSQDGMLAIGSADTGIIFYDVSKRSFITTVPFRMPTAIAFSSDCTRLAVGNKDGVVRLLDVPTITEASAQTSQENSAPVSALVFSPDCSCLVTGSEDGIIQIWDTSCASEPIVTREGHSSKITTLAFMPDGGQFASGDVNGAIKLWKSDDCALSDTVQWPISGELTSMAVVSFLLAVATKDSIALWDLQRPCIIDRLGECGSTLLSLSNQNEHVLLASFDGDSNSVTVWDTRSLTSSATFSTGPLIERMVFYPDDSHLLVQHDNGKGLWLFDVVNKVLPNGALITDLVDHGVIPSWRRIPVLMCYSNNHYFVRGWFLTGCGNYTYETVCQLPEDLDVVKAAYGSSMFALLCKNGSLLLLQSN